MALYQRDLICLVYVTICSSLLKGGYETNFIDRFHAFWSNAELNPALFLLIPELLVLEVRVKLTPRLDIRVRYTIT
ncbi:MAG: hypothetical protein RL220_40 [Bacteroidota bacterium]